jgi:hypothetical protein
MARQPAASVAIGFSTITSQPARSDWTVYAL